MSQGPTRVKGIKNELQDQNYVQRITLYDHEIKKVGRRELGVGPSAYQLRDRFSVSGEADRSNADKGAGSKWEGEGRKGALYWEEDEKMYGERGRLRP